MVLQHSPQSPGCGARSCFTKLSSASHICPRAGASPPQAQELNALYLCGRNLEWVKWKMGSWGCEFSYFTDAEEVRESEQPQFVYIEQLPWYPQLQIARALFGGQTRHFILALVYPLLFPTPSASTYSFLYRDRPYATDQYEILDGGYYHQS